MDIRELDRFDLNLLVALEVLLEERNVSRAAERLFISQSAMSKTLGRLRELFDDPLFTRSGSAMVATPRAEEIGGCLPRVLQQLRTIVQPGQFDPLTYQGEFSMVLPEYIGGWSLPVLFKNLSKIAPGIRLNTIASEEGHLEKLARGELDFVVQLELQSYPKGFHLHSLGFAPPRLFARKGHPLEGRDVSWEEVHQYPQIRLFVPYSKEVRVVSHPELFFQHQIQMEPHLTTKNLLTALQIVRVTDFIVAGPPLFVGDQDISKRLITLSIPEQEEVMLKFVIVYHERVAQSAAHQFFLQQFLKAVEHYRISNGLPDLEQMRQMRGLAY